MQNYLLTNLLCKGWKSVEPSEGSTLVSTEPTVSLYCILLTFHINIDTWRRPAPKVISSCTVILPRIRDLDGAEDWLCFCSDKLTMLIFIHPVNVVFSFWFSITAAGQSHCRAFNSFWGGHWQNGALWSIWRKRENKTSDETRDFATWSSESSINLQECRDKWTKLVASHSKFNNHCELLCKCNLLVC